MENANDVETVYNETMKAAEYVRAGNGPMILELKTWRQMGHAPNEPGTKYKDPAEQAMWLKRDPIKLLATKLKEQYQVQDEQINGDRGPGRAGAGRGLGLRRGGPLFSA